MPAGDATRRGNGHPDYIKWMLIAGAVAVAAVLAVLVAKRQHLFHSDVAVDRYRFPVAGIDVSKHNGKVDFVRVAQDGYEFVFIKASEGATYRDANFLTNHHAAKAAGLKVGAYHFFRKNREGETQAQNFLGAVEGLQLDLPLVVDVEDWDNDHFVSDTDVISRLKALVATLEKKGHKVMVYTNGNGYEKYYKPHLTGKHLWLCSFTAPGTLVGYGHVFQQYSHWGEVSGVDGDVDLNVFCGSREEWERFLKNQ